LVGDKQDITINLSGEQHYSIAKKRVLGMLMGMGIARLVSREWEWEWLDGNGR